MYNVLIVDDEIWMGLGLKKIISEVSSHFQVGSTATTVSNALATIDTQKIDLVITDIHMPGTDGIEFIRQIRERGLNTPIIVITGYSEFEYARKVIRYGVSDYLLKPINKEEIREQLEQLANILNKHVKAVSQESAYQLQNSKNGEQIIEWLIQRIVHNYFEDLSISVLADEKGFNPSYLSRLFKVMTGRNFIEYLTEVRMEKAGQMLVSTTLQIADISKKVGYWDEKHFSKTFKREKGMTPSEYRKFIHSSIQNEGKL